MIRFVEVTGIYLDDKKSFAFFDTTMDTFVGVDGSYTFDSVREFLEGFDQQYCYVRFERMKALIPESWYEKEKIQK